MTLPVHRMVHPSDLAGKKNGMLDRTVHVPVVVPGAGTSWMHHLAARALAVMSARCKAETGCVLSTVGMWRPLPVQEAGFFASYLDKFDPTLCTREQQRQYLDKTWYLRLHTIPKATPGKSEHGWGLADDLAILAGGKRVAVAGTKAWPWLKAHVVEHGFSWAYAAEGVDDPHVQYFAADNLPAVVLDFERTHGMPVIAPTPAAPSTGGLPPVPPPTIMFGDRDDPDVAALQQFLAALDLYALAVDGDCGPGTVEGIRGLQRLLAAAGLYPYKVDGIYGPKTREAFMAWPGRPK